MDVQMSTDAALVMDGRSNSITPRTTRLILASSLTNVRNTTVRTIIQIMIEDQYLILNSFCFRRTEEVDLAK